MKSKNILIPKVGCMATEVGKIVSNKCLDRNISLNTLKLEKLLILMQVEYIRKTEKAFFQETIIVSNQHNTRIKEVEEDFLPYAVNMDMISSDTRFCEYINLLMKQEEVVETIINKYGNLDAFDLEKTPDIQLMHKISEELNTQNIQPPLIFYGLGRFSNMNLDENTEPTEKQKFVVLAVPRNKPFVVAAEKAEEFKNQTNSPEDRAFVKELAETFRVNNLVEEGPVLKKVKKPDNK